MGSTNVRRDSVECKWVDLDSHGNYIEFNGKFCSFGGKENIKLGEVLGFFQVFHGVCWYLVVPATYQVFFTLFESRVSQFLPLKIPGVNNKV